MDNLYQDITWPINEFPVYGTVQTYDPVNNELTDIDQQTYDLLNSPLNLPLSNLTLYYPVSRDSEQLYPITYNLTGQVVTPFYILELIHTYYNTPLSEDSFRKLSVFGESDPQTVNEIIQDAIEDDESLVAKDLLLDKVFFEGLAPYEDGYEVIIGS